MTTCVPASPVKRPHGGSAVREHRRRVQFARATPADDQDIRSLLRTSPMGGSISLSLEREPDHFRDAHLPGESKQTIVARDAGRMVCVGSCTTRLRFVNGKPTRAGYLAGLRLAETASGRFDILRRGYEFFRESQAAAPAEFYFTSIASDNARARGFLERGLRGMPRYEFLGEFLTLLLPTGRLARLNSARSDTPRLKKRWDVNLSALADRLNEHAVEYQLAPHWTAEQLFALEALGLRSDDFFTSDRVEGGTVAALWDQRSFKQTVVRGYSRLLNWSRPAINGAAKVGLCPRLPDVGSTLSHAVVSHVGVGGDQCEALVLLTAELARSAARRQIEFLTLGFAANDPRAEVVRRNFRCREYRSRIYQVSWPGLGQPAKVLKNGLLSPEVALL